MSDSDTQGDAAAGGLAADAELYRDHLERLDGWLADAVERAGRRGVAVEAVVFHAGRARTYHADDQEIPFRGTPHFRRWVPLDGPEHLLVARPGERPRLARVAPADYWYDTAPPPPSYWERSLDLVEVETFAEALAALAPLGDAAWVGGAPEAAAAAGIPAERVEPEALMAPLDWHRGSKTDFEVARTAAAAERSAGGHLAAREAFAAGGSELEIYHAYLRGSAQVERHIPYESILALDEKAAILHYQHKRGREAAPGSVLLADAGAGDQGWAADLTRTWARPDAEPTFRALLAAMDAVQRELVAGVLPGASFVDLHLDAHRRVAGALAETGVLRVSAEEACDRGLMLALMPHGLGHHLGLQVHDVGGRQRDPDGGEVAPPEGHPFLRTTRPLAPGHLVTIEPGVYFIPQLLEPLRRGEHAAALDWQLVDRLVPCGGIRIEDNVLCTDGAPRDLSRPLLPGPRG